MSLARWIMDRATANPPRGREDWAVAMQAEFESMEADRLCWALGCWRTMAGWRLRNDWLFLAALGGISFAWPQWITPQAIWVLFNIAPEEVIRAAMIPTAFAVSVLPAVALAAWRPDHYRKTAVVIATAATAHTVFTLHSMGGGWFEPGWQYFNGPVSISAFALLGACWLGGATAAGFSRARRHSRRRFSAT